MSFSADIANAEQRAVIEIPSTGLSKKGKVVPLENFRLVLVDPADSAKLLIAAHEDGMPNKFVASAAAGFELTGSSVGVPVQAIADGRPGEGESDISDDGIVSIKAPDAATFGSAVAATVEDIP